MVSPPFLPAALLLSAPIGGYGALGYLFTGAILVVLVAVAIVSWRYGLRWVRRKQPLLVAVGAVALVVALASSLGAYQLAVLLVFE